MSLLASSVFGEGMARNAFEQSRHAVGLRLELTCIVCNLFSNARIITDPTNTPYELSDV